MPDAYIIALNAITVLAFAFASASCLLKYARTRKITSFWLAIAAAIFFFALPALANLLLALGITGSFASEQCSLCLLIGSLFMLLAVPLYKKSRISKKHTRHSR